MQEPSNRSDVEEEIEFRQIWDTAGIRPSDRFSYYREGICQTYFAISPEMPAGRQIDARIEVANLPEGNVSVLNASPHRNCRTDSDLSKIDGDFLTLNLQRVSIDMDLNGTTYSVSRGDIVLMDLHKKCVFEMMPEEKRLNVSLLVFPRSKVDKYFGSRDVILYDKCSLQALRTCLSLLEDRFKSGSRSELACIFDASLSLLTANLIRDRDYLEHSCASQPSIAGGIFQAIKAYIEANAADPNLSVTFVATRFSISDRYIHKIFEREKMTFKSFLTDFRLNKIRSELMKGNQNNKTASAIAFKWGFRNMSTFYRNFKAAFDETPYRMQRFRQPPER